MQINPEFTAVSEELLDVLTRQNKLTDEFTAQELTIAEYAESRAPLDELSKALWHQYSELIQQQGKVLIPD
jgi:hypothetical protein